MSSFISSFYIFTILNFVFILFNNFIIHTKIHNLLSRKLTYNECAPYKRVFGINVTFNGHSSKYDQENTCFCMNDNLLIHIIYMNVLEYYGLVY